MLETYIRPVFQKIFVNTMAKIVSRYCHANSITIASLMIGLLSALSIGLNWTISAVILMLISGYLDILDGSVARFNKASSSWGTVLDIMSDRTVEVAIILGFALRTPELAIVFLLMMGATLLCVSSFLVIGIFSVNTTNKSFYYSPGLIERAEAFIFFIAMICFINWELWIALLYIAFVLWTAGFRVFEFYQNLRRNQE